MHIKRVLKIKKQISYFEAENTPDTQQNKR